MTTYELPLTPKPQTLSTTLPSGVGCQFRFLYQFVADNDCWIMDIADAQGSLLACGIPLVTGADLLEQFGYLGLGVKLWVTTDGDADVPPRWWNLGRVGGGHLWIEG